MLLSALMEYIADRRRQKGLKSRSTNDMNVIHSCAVYYVKATPSLNVYMHVEEEFIRPRKSTQSTL